MFTTDIKEVINQVEEIDPFQYGKTRNFLNGAVTRLSPYISRGVISPKFILDKIVERKPRFHEIERLAMELAWREYFQNIWLTCDINEDVKQPQPDVQDTSMPKALIEARTGIEVIDQAVKDLYDIGYVHNHQRMYIASVVCNIAKSHWKLPAKWFYFHLLDADWASNALSWQWTAAAFSNKKYYANQENINKYGATNQRGTFLDVAYEDFAELPIPEVLREMETPLLETNLPPQKAVRLDSSLPTLVYNFYNLDPFWKCETRANRVLLLEPSHFAEYPTADKTLDFVYRLAENISDIQIFTGEFAELKKLVGDGEIYYKEHPTAAHYAGIREERDWMFPEVRGFFRSYFNYWKKCEKILKLRLHEAKKAVS